MHFPFWRVFDMQGVSLFPHPLFTLFLVCVFACAAAGCSKNRQENSTQPGTGKGGSHRFLVLDPGHFHAGLVFKRATYDGLSQQVGVYAPVGEDAIDFLNLTTPFNSREDDPTKWSYRMYLGPDFLETMLGEKAGDIVIISGKNNEKIDRIMACVKAGYNVLADKPWIIEPEKFALLDSALTLAEKKNIPVYDIMTERFEITSILQRLIAENEKVFGVLTTGTPEEPAVENRSVHHLLKLVAGNPAKRPAWFFDTAVQGEGMVDVTTHLVDIVFFTLYPEQAIDYRKDVEMISADHWPTMITPEQFWMVTGKQQFPSSLKLDKKGDFPYFCNGSMNFRLKGKNVKVQVEWKFQAPEGGGDTHYSLVKGTRSHVMIIQDKEQKYIPELYVQPAPGVKPSEVKETLTAFIASLAVKDYPGLSVVEEKGRFRIDIPVKYRVGHEAHFGQVTDRFLGFLDGKPMPSWERPNMLAKYFITTKALELSRKKITNSGDSSR
jgi:predicted dehydrogenase